MIVPLYASVLGISFTLLSSRVIYIRRTTQTPHGNPKSNPELEKAMRVQENFSQYVPIAMLLFWMCEKEDALTPRNLHITAGVFTFGRFVHMIATSQVKENYLLRPLSMSCTLNAILVAAVALLRK